MEKPLVSIACITYNQAKYIRQCLDGFVMQKTKFPIEIVIHDDASTDKTQDIIREYIEKYPQFLWKPIFQKENKYKQGKGILVPYVYPECTGKYIALCEGDDYWCDENKLQMQIDYLEHNTDCVMIYSDYSCVDKDDQGIICNKLTPLEGNVAQQLVHGNCACTPTVIFRFKMFDGYDQFVNNFGTKLMFGDLSTWLYLSTKGKLHYLNRITAHYRVLSDSASHSTTNKEYLYAFAKNLLDFKLYANKTLDINANEKGIYKTYYNTMLRYTSQHSFADFVRIIPSALRTCPTVFTFRTLSRCTVNLFK
ncbi:MAG: glycosyltransferase [Prevotellaceae bacterium]|nr:glycosyltransferase [Candidatus Minthosoma equi]